MKTFAKLVLKSGLTSALLTAAFGCSVSAFEQAPADARTDGVDAKALVTAAGVRVRGQEADTQGERRGDTKAPAKGVIPTGTVLKISLIDALDSGTSKPDDRFLASLAEAVVVNGTTLLPRGTRVRGRVVNVAGATIRLELTDIAQSNKRRVPITTGMFEAIAKESRYHPGTRLEFTLTDSAKL